ncbi:hypothetical protein GOBAR_AA18437 [Gossypium barbadense]|uniref:Uncharacterized protein n=1 Tax=Gossypium barbadense TaxID=3634 RepID=A0A2P5XFW1_GOSBA|nr:hypothetical protein GOBAR_AA18437 [Gossypium barbadense]
MLTTEHGRGEFDMSVGIANQPAHGRAMRPCGTLACPQTEHMADTHGKKSAVPASKKRKGSDATSLSATTEFQKVQSIGATQEYTNNPMGKDNPRLPCPARPRP